MMKDMIRFGVIGCGLMGREFASAAARWCHLEIDVPRPEIIGVCDTNPAAVQWFKKHIPSIKYATDDYNELLSKPDIDAIYCALPHVLHEKVYCDVISAGKHLLGEKPFGIDKKANEHILVEAAKHPECLVRCASEFPYFPASQMLIKWINEGKFGKIIEVKTGLHHSSDIDLNKPINWKRRIEVNGEYGCMGDLGIHTQHIPFRMGWTPKNVYAVLSDIVKERPDGKGGIAKCETWDNATLLCEVEDKDGSFFPMTVTTKRISPGSTNEWFLEVYGLNCSAKVSTNDPNAFFYTQTVGREQAWCRLSVGNKPLYPTITGNIFEFGFSDAIQQMWASFMLEIAGEDCGFGCFRPEETHISHMLQTAALLSYHQNRCVDLEL